MATRINDKRATVRSLVTADLLNADGVELLRRWEQIKADYKEIGDHVKLLTDNTIERYGCGVHSVNGVNITLTESERQSVSWKSLAYAVADEAVINDQLPSFTEAYKIRSAKVA
jgi:hypothetical protein